jgi:hypothetical protein
LWPPINVNDVFRCSYRRPSSRRRTKRYSRSFSGAPSGGRPFPADRAVNAVFPLFLPTLLPAAALFRPTAPSMRYSRSSFGAPSDGRPSPANRAVSSSGNFCQSLSRRSRHPSRPKEPPKVVFKPRIGGSVQSQPIPALHAHYAPHQTTDQTLRVQIRRDHRRPSFHAHTRAPRRICSFGNALHALSRAAMVIHALPRAGTVFPRAGTRRLHLPRAPTRSGAFRRVRSTRHFKFWRSTRLLAREMHAPGALARSRAYWRVSCTRFLQPQASRVHNTRQAFSPFSCCHVSLREPPRQP